MEGIENHRCNEDEREPLRVCKSLETSNFIGALLRWRQDQHPCCPSLTIGGIHDRRFQFCTLLTDLRQRVRLAAGNVRNCANHAAAMVMVLELEAILSPPVSAKAHT